MFVDVLYFGLGFRCCFCLGFVMFVALSWILGDLLVVLL